MAAALVRGRLGTLRDCLVSERRVAQFRPELRPGAMEFASVLLLLAKFTHQLRRRRRRRPARVAATIIAPSRRAPPENATQNKRGDAHRGARQVRAVADIILRVDEPPLVREVKYR